MLTPGHKIRLKTLEDPPRYLRHRCGRIYADPWDCSSLFSQDSLWIVRRGITGKGQTVSFESVNYPGDFVSVDGRMVSKRSGRGHEEECTWSPSRAGFDRLPRCVRFTLAGTQDDCLFWPMEGQVQVLPPFGREGSIHTGWLMEGEEDGTPPSSPRAATIIPPGWNRQFPRGNAEYNFFKALLAILQAVDPQNFPNALHNFNHVVSAGNLNAIFNGGVSLQLTGGYVQSVEMVGITLQNLALLAPVEVLHLYMAMDRIVHFRNLSMEEYPHWDRDSGHYGASHAWARSIRSVLLILSTPAFAAAYGLHSAAQQVGRMTWGEIVNLLLMVWTTTAQVVYGSAPIDFGGKPPLPF
ncbi:unnamed protein product [Symbiodinium sp. CCMP2592]|nr:unnamed protein product [Symbiodinium sp. CCMP2592]